MISELKIHHLVAFPSKIDQSHMYGISGIGKDIPPEFKSKRRRDMPVVRNG